jgi:ADP-heptose:LPS heptosyltransferase
MNPKINPATDRVSIPVTFIPQFRTEIALQNGVENNLLFRTWGGLGDQICAEPTLRFALKTFKGATITLASENPELFTHLKFDKVYNLKKEKPDYTKYLCFETITPPDESNLVWQFFGHMITNCVDFPSMCALRFQLPMADKEVHLVGKIPNIEIPEKAVFIHAGRHWPSKTFPKDWWDAVLAGLIAGGAVPVLIGANNDDNRGTVDVNPDGCLDLRNKTTIMETIGLLNNAKVLITNDSSPLHMAVAGDAMILYFATCKHYDYITHWRKGQWSYKMENLSLGGIWELMDYCPNKKSKVTADEVDEDILRSWLPEPITVAHRALKEL